VLNKGEQYGTSGQPVLKIYKVNTAIPIADGDFRSEEYKNENHDENEVQYEIYSHLYYDLEMVQDSKSDKQRIYAFSIKEPNVVGEYVEKELLDVFEQLMRKYPLSVKRNDRIINMKMVPIFGKRIWKIRRRSIHDCFCMRGTVRI
jgi:hypothetical protein